MKPSMLVSPDRYGSSNHDQHGKWRVDGTGWINGGLKATHVVSVIQTRPGDG